MAYPDPVMQKNSRHSAEKRPRSSRAHGVDPAICGASEANGDYCIRNGIHNGSTTGTQLAQLQAPKRPNTHLMPVIDQQPLPTRDQHWHNTTATSELRQEVMQQYSPLDPQRHLPDAIAPQTYPALVLDGHHVSTAFEGISQPYAGQAAHMRGLYSFNQLPPIGPGSASLDQPPAVDHAPNVHAQPWDQPAAGFPPGTWPPIHQVAAHGRNRSFTQRIFDRSEARRPGYFPTPSHHNYHGASMSNTLNVTETDRVLRMPAQMAAVEPRKVLSYPEHVLNKANELYAAMIAEAQHIRSRRAKDPTINSRRVFSDGFACVEAPRAPDFKAYEAKASRPVKRRKGLLEYEHPRGPDTLGIAQSTSQQRVNVVPPEYEPSWSFHHDAMLAGPNSIAKPGSSGHCTSNSALWSSARATYQSLTQICVETNESWNDAMHLAGCFAFALGNLNQAASWFGKVAAREPNPIAFSNLALTSLAGDCSTDAEAYWDQALKIKPTYFEAAEHLVSLLCHRRRHKHAVQTIDFVRRSLRANGRKLFYYFRPVAYGGHFLHEVNLTRLLGLIHAKAAILYSIGHQTGAAVAFIEMLSLAFGLEGGNLLDLVQFVHGRLAAPALIPAQPRTPLLLAPGQAITTIQRTFGHGNYLPGLTSVSDASSRQTAFSVTSSALLSLAKILQDRLFSPSAISSPLVTGYGTGEVLILYYLSLSILPSPSTANNIGILLASIQSGADSSSANECSLETGLASQYYRYGLTLDHKHAHLYTNYGSFLKDIGQRFEAIKMYESAVACDPKFDIALANLANAVKDEGRTEEAISYYKRAVDVNPTFVEAACGLANALMSICAWDNRGGVYLPHDDLDRWHVNEYGYLNDARVSSHGSGWLQRVVKVLDNQLESGKAWGQGHVRFEALQELLRQAHMNDAAAGSTELQRLYGSVYAWMGRTDEGWNVLRLVERTNRQTQRHWYLDRSTGHETYSYFRARPITDLPMPQTPTILPFHTFTLPLTAKQIRLISHRSGSRVSYSALVPPWLPDTVFPPPLPPSPHLNVGYVSSDFNNHPLSHLMQSIFGMHDRRRVNAICYATRSSDNSAYRRKIETDAPVFHDASSWSNQRLISQIVQDQVHILINLNGYTRGARNEVFAARPAPIQMSFMGFAGSMGAEWSDYLLADEVAVPPNTLRPHRSNVTIADLVTSSDPSISAADDWVYNENIIYTPSSFFCCDHLQTATDAERHRTWPQEISHRRAMRHTLFGTTIPPNAVILANFNQLYKIDPTTFRTWLRILSRVPHAYLWLLRFPAAGEANLLRFARLWAPESVAARIIFTDVAPKTEHIARGCIADLFLDTPECNAHTTAADCLWSGTPLLTLPRYEWKMCSRMAAGILRGALPMETAAGREAWNELVVHSEEEYEETAVRLAGELRYTKSSAWQGLGERKEEFRQRRELMERDVRAREKETEMLAWEGTGRLMDLRRLIWESRWTCSLFDTRGWVRNLEVAYAEAWRRWVANKGGDIWLKDLL